MASFNVILYKSTGFNVNNVPDGSSLLLKVPSTNKLTIDAVWLLQDDTGSIKIKATWNQVESVDYCRIDNKYYFVTGVTMLNENTARLDLQFDALTTVGIRNFKIINGWCTRRHVSNDELFSNTISEDFVPIEIEKVDFSKLYSGVEENVKIIIASTIPLDDISAIAKTYKDNIEQLSVTVPQINSIKYPTTCIFNVTGTNGFLRTLPQIALYDFEHNSDVYLQALKDIYSLGLTDALLAAYTIRWDQTIEIQYWDGYSNNESTAIKIISLTQQNATALDVPFKWNVNNYTVKNNKVFSGQYNKYEVMSITSGNSTSFYASQIFNKDKTSGFKDYPEFWVSGDPAPNGKTYCRPQVYEGNIGVNGEDGFLQLTEGSIWQNQQLTFQGAEGWQVLTNLQRETRNANIINEASSFMGMLGNLIATTSAITSNIGALSSNAGEFAGSKINAMNTASSFGQGNYFPDSLYSSDPVYRRYNSVSAPQAGGFMGATNRLIGSEMRFQTGINMTPPNVKFPISDNLMPYVGNKFFVVRYRLSDADTIRYDKYLTAYGYNTSEPLTAECFTCRKYFNYVRATDVNIDIMPDNPNFGLRTRQQIANQLNAGVRIWHVLPNSTEAIDAFEYNPIK